MTCLNGMISGHMIQVSNLSKAYGAQVIFDQAGFSINAGERVGLIGRNGSGKTTLFRMILGEEHPDAGAIRIPDRYRIGHLSQHLRFGSASVLEEACLGLPEHEDGRDETFRVKAILMGLGFSEEDFLRPPGSLSGGFQVRLNLARVLAEGPDLLLLDEPTNYLDIVSIRWLVRFLRGWQGEIILITHDRDFMDSVTTHTMGIHRCKIRKIEGPTSKLAEQIIQEEEVYERTRLNDERRRQEAEEFINRFRAQANRARAVQSRIKALNRQERAERLGDLPALDFAFTSALFTARELIRAENVSFSYGPDNPPLINNLDLSIGRRDRIAVIGRNGRGKSTLLRLLAGELDPCSGSISRHQQLRAGFFGQTNIDRLAPGKTVEDEIMDAHPQQSRNLARNICGAMLFSGDLALKKVAVLSGGEKSRVLLGKLLVTPANLLLLDEPTNHLDMESVDSLINAIEAFDGAVVIVTHSEMILNAVAERLVVFDSDTVRPFEGTYADFLERVGWRDEDTESTGQRHVERTGAASRKDLRRFRAGVIAERSRVLGPLQARITGTEEEIMRLEQDLEQDTAALLSASATGDGEAIGRLSKAIHTARERIDVLFSELEALATELEARSREFEERLNGPGQPT